MVKHGVIHQKVTHYRTEPKVSNGSPSQPFNDSTEYPTYESIQQLEEIGHEQQLHPSGWN